MTVRVDTNLLPEIQAYGAVDIQACFNCGNCTAVCPLSEDASFPRKIIRYAQIGAKQALVGSKELWHCYYCGECSKTCPRQAEPGEFMAAARRYAIAEFDITGVAKGLFKYPWLNMLVSFLLALFFSAFLLAFNQGTAFEQLAFWEYLPEVVVQVSGIALFVLVLLVMLAGVARMARSLAFTATHVPSSSANGTGVGTMSWGRALWEALAHQALGHAKYREDECEEERSRPWFVRKWFTHATILYGFLGLFAATALDFLFKPVGSIVPIYYPMRLLGTISGIALMYGTTLALIHRLQKRDKYASHSKASDWVFLVLIWLVGLTGFLLEIANYAPPPTRWSYAFLILHIALVMDLFVLVPVSKFAHVIYRTTAILMHNLKTRVASEEEQAAVIPA